MRVLNVAQLSSRLSGKKDNSNLSCDLISKMLILFWEYLKIVNLCTFGQVPFFPPLFFGRSNSPNSLKKEESLPNQNWDPCHNGRPLAKASLGCFRLVDVDIFRSYLKQEVHWDPRCPEMGASSKGNGCFQK